MVYTLLKAKHYAVLWLSRTFLCETMESSIISTRARDLEDRLNQSAAFSKSKTGLVASQGAPFLCPFVLVGMDVTLARVS